MKRIETSLFILPCIVTHASSPTALHPQSAGVCMCIPYMRPPLPYTSRAVNLSLQPAHDPKKSVTQFVCVPPPPVKRAWSPGDQMLSPVTAHQQRTHAAFGRDAAAAAVHHSGSLLHHQTCESIEGVFTENRLQT